MKRKLWFFILRTVVAAVALWQTVSVLQFLYDINYSYIPYNYHLLNLLDYSLEKLFLTISAGFAFVAVFSAKPNLLPFSFS